MRLQSFALARILGLGAVFFAGTSFADFKSAYTDGVRASDSQDWALVETKMREALSGEPTSQAKVRLYGMRFEPYLPYHYLALAAAARGNCGAALAALNNSGHQAALAGARDAEALFAAEAQIQRRCQNGAVTPPTTAPPPVVPAPLPLPIVKPPLVKPPVTAQPPSVIPAVIAQAKPALASEDVARVRALLQGLKRELSAARSAYTRPEIAASAGAKLTELSVLESDSVRLSGELERAINAVDAPLLARTGSAARAASVRASAIKIAGNAALAAAAPIARPVAPAALAGLAKTFFAGDFKLAAQSNVETLQGKALAHALLLRAAARFSLFVAQGESKPEQLVAVKTDLARAKSVDAGVRPSAKYFSPRLVLLY
jgi:hypothetical protein